jgi:RNA polymerase sigma factor (sigma-70 family)
LSVSSSGRVLVWQLVGEMETALATAQPATQSMVDLNAEYAFARGALARSLLFHLRRPRPGVSCSAGRTTQRDLSQAADDGPTPEEQVVQDERELHARRLLSELGEEQREILSLRFAAELTYAEIAAVIGKREEAVKKIAYRTLQLLRERNFYD